MWVRIPPCALMTDLLNPELLDILFDVVVATVSGFLTRLMDQCDENINSTDCVV